MLVIVFISRLVKYKVSNIKPVLLQSESFYFKLACKSQLCCAVFLLTVCAVCEIGVFRSGSSYCSFVDFNPIIFSVSS